MREQIIVALLRETIRMNNNTSPDYWCTKRFLRNHDVIYIYLLIETRRDRPSFVEKFYILFPPKSNTQHREFDISHGRTKQRIERWLCRRFNSTTIVCEGLLSWWLWRWKITWLHEHTNTKLKIMVSYGALIGLPFLWGP